MDVYQLIGYGSTSLDANTEVSYQADIGSNINRGIRDLAALESLAPGADAMSDDKRIALHYALGKAYDDLKDFDRGFPHFIEGARIKRAKLHYDAGADEARAHRIAEIVNADFLARHQGAGNGSDVPVFVLGMPRSGTTLTEQIIASHPDVFGAGELSDLMDIAQQQTGNGGFLAYPENLARLDKATLTAWGDDYVVGLKRRAPNATLITQDARQLSGLGPRSAAAAQGEDHPRQRNPVDTCVSCFTRLFNRYQDATYDLYELGRHYAA